MHRAGTTMRTRPAYVVSMVDQTPFVTIHTGHHRACSLTTYGVSKCLSSPAPIARTSLCSRCDVTGATNDTYERGMLMPPGLTAGLRRDEFVDLVRFLSELGKEGKYKVQAEGVIRRWRLPVLPGDFWQVLNRDGLRALAVEQAGVSWMPIYSEVGGELALGEIPVVKLFQTSGRVVQGEVEVTTAGAMVMKFGSVKGVRAWVGEREVTPGACMTA